MLKKVFLLTQFGPPHAWTEQYLQHVRSLEKYGWYWKVFTPHKWESSGNVEIVPMTLAQFDALVEQRCGVAPGNYLNAAGLPSKLLSDYYPAFGDIFSEYIQDFQYWGHTNWDMVYGRLDHFLNDEELARWDIWSDDRDYVNGIFCLYRNALDINNLYRQVLQWQMMFQDHRLFGFDEVQFSVVVRNLAARYEIRFGHPPYFPLHSYDRLVQHHPTPHLMAADDGALLEGFEDRMPALLGYAPWRGCFAREIMAFHFIRTKQWPTITRMP